MRTIKTILLVLILLAIVILAVANRQMVTVALLPEGLSRIMPGASVQMPLFLVSLISIAVGLVLGYLLEYLREAKYRRRAAEKSREAARLSRDMSRLRKEANRPEDDVLALVGN